VSGNAGVVHEDIQAAQLVARRIERMAPRGWIGYVTGNCDGTPTHRTYLLHDLGKSILAPRKKDAIDAAPREFHCQSATDAARCARD
jgi:hypothetical protein